jgi:hypothetical protein
MLDLRPYLQRPMVTLASVASDPLGAWIRFREQYAAHREGVTPADFYQADSDWEDQLCRMVSLGSSDNLAIEFRHLWNKVLQELELKGIQAGPASFKGWNDGDAGFVRAIWFLVRQLRPAAVVETGVAHGVTSRFILEALEKNGRGHLWSIDRPPIDPEWQSQIGVAVDDRLRHRWSYIRGSSRQQLPGLLSKLGKVDLFIHDSLHSERNVRFEMDSVWQAMAPGGAIVVDDIDVNKGFRSFTQVFPGHRALVCESEPIRPDLRRFNKKGLFGIVRKQ